MKSDMSVLAYQDALQFAQRLPPMPVYSVKDVAEKIHERTVRRKIKKLEEMGLARYGRGRFSIKREVVSQPIRVLERLTPSLAALARARRFGRSYGQSDINFMVKNLPENAIPTLDYAAHKMTKYQSVRELYAYVDDAEETARFLKTNGFREGKKGNVVILPKTGMLENTAERVFLDCIAKGGRSTMDAVAIQLRYPAEISTEARFTIETLLKVQEDLPVEPIR